MDIEDRVAQLEWQMKLALEGVSNFKNFQTRATDFFTRHEERELARERAEIEKAKIEETRDKKRARIHYWWLGLLSALIVVGFSIVLTWFFQIKTVHHISEAPSISESTQQNAFH